MTEGAAPILRWMFVMFTLALVPPLLIGFIRKTKANLQGRIGAPIYQPLFDLAKLFAKGELVSTIASVFMRGSAVTSAAVMILIAMSTPWIPGMPSLLHMDIVLLVYLFVVIRFFTVLGALDTASPFGGFAASREVTLAVLVEPAVMLCLAALAVAGRTTQLDIIFSFSSPYLSGAAALWVMAGTGLYLSSLVELSRMPADDPTTHLELTMVHEAMILENSGPNLALIEYTGALKVLVLFGIAAQCMVHAIPGIWLAPTAFKTVCGALAIAALLGLTAFIEATAVKLRWTKLPDFIGYAVTFGLLSVALTLGTFK